MNPLHQLTRRPVKAAFGVLLLALAGAILCLSGGQYWAAVQTRAAVERTYTTVAVITGLGSSEETADSTDAESLRQSSATGAAIFFQAPEQQSWDIIRSRPTVGMVSGYSPCLKPAISLYTGHSGIDAPYGCSIVEIRADAVTEVNNDWFGESGAAVWQLDGQVLGIYGLNDAFRDPSGQRASVTLCQEYDDPAELLHPEAGKRYLLLSRSYGDSEWSLRRNVADWVFMESNVQSDPWSLDILGNLIRYDQRKNQSEHWYHTAGDAAEEPVEFAPEELLYRDPATGVEVTSIDPDAFGQFSFAVDALKDTGEIMVEDPQQPGNWRPETVDYTQYNLPSIQELPDGVTAQEVIDSTSSWRMAMESIQTNNHSVPVLAVDSVEGMLEFASGRTQITQGRSISQEEYCDGAAVCLISETLARESGLDVGDTLPLSLYEKEKNLMPTTVGDSDPTASYYLPQRGFQQETEYTVIGLYRQSSEWGKTVASFTPNSVLTPKKSVTCAMETGGSAIEASPSGLWGTMILKNGTADQMEARLKENNLAGTVTYYDQGYSEIVESLDGFSRVSRTVLWVGLALWVVVLAAYCVLFPLQEGKTALRMWTLGTVKRDITGSIWLSSAAVAVIGTVIALAVSIPGMSWAIGKLQELTGSELAMSVSPWQTAALCAVVLVLELAAVALCSALAARRGIRKAA
ncbi:MAG: ABC transporter permease [Oscillospiraceae bacterium]